MDAKDLFLTACTWTAFDTLCFPRCPNQTHFGYLNVVFWILVTAKYAKISLYLFLGIYNTGIK